MGIPDHLTCLLGNLFAGQVATVRTGHGTQTGSISGKEYIMRNAELEEAQAGIKIAGRNINNLRYADDTTHGRKWRRTKGPLGESERGEWKSWSIAQHSEN